MQKIIQNKYISSTDLKNKTKDVLDITESLGEVFIMNNNKPRAVLISVERYNYINNFHIPEVEPDDWEKQSIENYIMNEKNWKNEYIDEDEFFRWLK